MSIPVLDANEMRRAVVRMASEITERNGGAANLALLGILTRGAPLARRLAEQIATNEGQTPPVGSIDIGLYRDDYGLHATQINPTDIPFDVTGKVVILVDEVCFTGRTVRAAIDAIMDLGRPASIQLAVFVDRGHRELPIQPDYVAKALKTEREDHVQVHFEETDGVDSVRLIQKDGGDV